MGYRFVAIFARHCRFYIHLGVVSFGRVRDQFNQSFDFVTILAGEVHVTIGSF
jgi:hypothetical protein